MWNTRLRASCKLVRWPSHLRVAARDKLALPLEVAECAEWCAVGSRAALDAESCERALRDADAHALEQDADFHHREALARPGADLLLLG